jgi:hypothetical protein
MALQAEARSDSPEQQIVRQYGWRVRIFRTACVMVVVWGLLTFAVLTFLPGEKEINFKIFEAIYLAVLLAWGAVFYAVLRCPACDNLNPLKKGACKTCSAPLK